MSPDKIVVLVLCLAAVAFLVWVELNSRRNAKALKDQPQQAKDAK